MSLGFRVCFLVSCSMVAALVSIGYASAPSTSDKSTEVSLEFKIGQMLLIGYHGLEVTDQHPAIRDIRELYLGGVILSDYHVASQKHQRNIESPDQVRRLTEALQQASTVPLLIAMDHEGGIITRLKESYGFPPTVSHEYLGTIDDPATTYREARKMAETLSSIGVNLNLAPVVDLNINSQNPIIARLKRSFSADPESVTRHAAEFIQAHRELDVFCSVKHFPGHGSAADDSHLGLVDVSNVWSRTELEPYRRLIEAGKVDVIMTAHVFNTHLDPHYPATLSRATITGILRDEWNYDGVVISDDLEMQAIAKNYGFETAVLKALEAGVDVLLIANNSDKYDETIARRTFNLIRGFVREGVISEKRIDQSYHRIQTLKSSLNNKAMNVPLLEYETVESPDLEDLMVQFARIEEIGLKQSWLPTPDSGFNLTDVKVAWNPEGLYVFARLQDEDIFSNSTDFNQRLWELGDVFETFIHLEKSDAYYEFHVSPNNHVMQIRFDVSLTPAQRRLQLPDLFMPEQVVRSTVWVNEAKNQWCVLLVIPASVLKTSGIFVSGDTLNVSFSRYDYNHASKEPILSSSSDFKELDFHRRENWGKLRLAGSPNGSP
jgi:beta-N-acetylhexosaminidase